MGKRKEKVEALVVLVVIVGIICTLCGFVLYMAAEEPRGGVIGFVLILIGIFLILILGNYFNSLAVEHNVTQVTSKAVNVMQ